MAPTAGVPPSQLIPRKGPRQVGGRAADPTRVADRATSLVAGVPNRPAVVAAPTRWGDPLAG